jgi:hypothetical protein
VQKLGRAIYENAALDLLTRKGIGVIWELHLDAANAYRNGCPQSAEILIETADGGTDNPSRQISAGEGYEMTLT